MQATPRYITSFVEIFVFKLLLRSGMTYWFGRVVVVWKLTYAMRLELVLRHALVQLAMACVQLVLRLVV